MGKKFEEQSVSETNELDDDLFSAGFDEVLGGEDDKTPPAFDEPPDTENPPVAETTPEAPPAAAATPAEELAEQAAQTLETLRYNSLKADTPPVIDIKAIVAETLKATTPAAPAADPAVETPPAPTAEELAAEEQYRKDWPDHAAREDRLKSEIEGLKSLLTQTVAAIQSQVNPIVAQANLSAEEAHYAAIYAKHADADQIVGDVEKWIETQPAILRPAYTKALNEGTSTEVVEVFDLYRKDVPKVATPAPAADTTVTDELAERRLKRMETPTQVRTSVTADDDVDDFDSAFDAEAKKLAKQG